MADESLILDYGSASSIELNNPGVVGAFMLETLDVGIPARRPTWIQGDSNGSVLPTDPPYDDAVGTCTVRVQMSDYTAMDSALALLGQLTQKLAECSAAGPDGLPVLWTPANATQGQTMYWKLAEYDGAPPVTVEDLWFAANPKVTIRFTRAPGIEQPEVILPSSTAGGPMQTITVTGVPGDLPAKGRLIFTDPASKSRRFLEWGLEQRNYNSATSLRIDSGSLVTTGFGGASTGGVSSFNANVIRGTLTSAPSAVCGTGNLSHIGTFRVRARVKASSASVYVRLKWQDGSGVFRSNTYALPPVSGAWADVDLGTITVTKALSGTQQWSGRIEAIGASGDTLDVDYLLLIPAAEGYGKARANYSYAPGAIVALDDFATIGGSNLSGRTALSGGLWTSTGSTTDFSGGGNMLFRNTVSDASARIAVLGSNQTNTEVRASTYPAAYTTNTARQGVVARYVDASNFATAWLNASNNWFSFEAWVAGSLVAFNTVTVPALPNRSRGILSVYYTIRLVIYDSGIARAWLIERDSGLEAAQITLPPVTALATGGALASGKGGLYDYATTSAAAERDYDDVAISIPAPEPVVLYSGQQAQVRWDGAIRRDSGGTVAGPMPTYRGAHFWLPPAGDKGLTSRIAVRARRNDLEDSADDSVAFDNLTVQVAYTPRRLLPG